MGINVLSLFDGISCGQVALERAGIKVDNYFASEVDLKAIKITKKNYPNTLQVGDVTKVQSENLTDIDLLIGGSPCQSFSNAGKRDGFDGKSGLFWQFVRILKEVKPKYFMLENVKMKQEWRDVITEALGVEPIEIDSALVSAQQRKRLYWTNIPIKNMQIEDKKIYLSDVLGIKVDSNEDRIIMTKSDFDVKVRKYYIDKLELCKYLRKFKNKTIKEIADHCSISITKAEHWFRLDSSFAIPDENSWFKLKELFGIDSDKYDKEITEFEIKRNNFDMAKRIYDVRGKHPTLTTLSGGHQRKTIKNGDDLFYLTPEHSEKLQTLPEGYTEGITDNQRFKAIGNGWTVDVIAHILKGLKDHPRSLTIDRPYSYKMREAVKTGEAIVEKGKPKILYKYEIKRKTHKN
ncbi:MAG TPA: DNA (cytosine-5-)-methyltransferase [Candidatus Glassbacteria bacterium]|nr:DNA (cytosine-5-)-methyltransferase [Candidatus Glassbacteria bacterium]